MNIDDQLFRLLIKIAARYGFSIPFHRFNFIHRDENNLTLLSLPNKAIEIWTSIFPASTNSHAHMFSGDPKKTDLPLLWINEQKQKLALIKGVLTNGDCTAEYADGKDLIIPEKELSLGVLISLKIETISVRDQSSESFSLFLSAIKKKKWVFIEGMFASFVVSLLALGLSFFTMQAYDRVVPTENYSTLMVLAIGAILAIFFELILKTIRSRSVDKACKSIDEELSSLFLGKVLGTRLDAMPQTVGTLGAQIKSYESVRNFMTSTTLFLLADAPYALFFIFIIYTVGGSLAFVPLLLLPICLAVGFLFKWRLKNLSSEQLAESNRKNGLLIESIENIETIKSIGSEWKILDKWKLSTSKASEYELQTRNITSFSASLTQTIQQLSYISLISFGIYEIHAGQITQGALIACSIISNRALSPILSIPGIISQWETCRASLTVLNTIINLPSDRPKGKPIIPEYCTGYIKLDGAFFGYSPVSLALKPTNLIIKPGDRLAVIGPVGSGKTTLIKLISGLYLPKGGKVFLDDIDMSLVAPEFLREHMGYLPQDSKLFNGTLKDNLILGLTPPSDEEILKAAKETGLYPFIKNHPQGFNMQIYEGGRGLSGGQKQLVAITRVLLMNPEILILDEPTASMDNELEQYTMKNFFTGIRSDSTLIMTTHKLSLLNYVNRIIVMDNNRIVLDGSRDEVLKKLTEVKKNLNS
jgi:ATP-binding cassette subfamily C protein LapB